MERSAPEQKAPSAPVITTTRSVLLAAISVKMRAISNHMAALIALRSSGRLMVTVTSPSLRSTRMSAIPVTVAEGGRRSAGASRRLLPGPPRDCL